MAHAPHFDEGDPTLNMLREVCLELPGADMKVSHGRPAFFTKKIFAIYGAVTKGDRSGAHDQSLVFLPSEEDREAIDQDERFFTPAYWGPYGWRGIDLGPDVDWIEVRELVEESFRETAAKGLIRELDERLAS